MRQMSLFTHCFNTVHGTHNHFIQEKIYIKNGSHGTIYTFKNYFAIVFSVFSFSNNKFNPNGPQIISIDSLKDFTSTLFFFFFFLEGTLFTLYTHFKGFHFYFSISNGNLIRKKLMNTLWIFFRALFQKSFYGEKEKKKKNFDSIFYFS